MTLFDHSSCQNPLYMGFRQLNINFSDAYLEIFHAAWPEKLLVILSEYLTLSYSLLLAAIFVIC